MTAAGNVFLATGSFLAGLFLVGDGFFAAAAVADAAADEAVVKNPEESDSSESGDDSRSSLDGAAFDFGNSFLLKVFLLLGSGVRPGVVFRSLLALAMATVVFQISKGFHLILNFLRASLDSKTKVFILKRFAVQKVLLEFIQLKTKLQF